ncbi:MAG: hypothetical protein U9Q74_11740 [Gemmatimonadota bacterium]|nr:hypothetical protein [Gemmatimonadota bacterium]
MTPLRSGARLLRAVLWVLGLSAATALASRPVLAQAPGTAPRASATPDSAATPIPALPSPGEVRGEQAAVEPPRSAGDRVRRQVLLVAAWLTIVLVIGAGTLMLASDNLMAVADALERHYGTALVAGLAGQVAFAPLLAALVVALVLTILGILLIPFAVVSYVIVAAGIVTLGFLATAVVVGRGGRPAPATTDRARRAATLRALVVGSVVLVAPWLVAALLAAWPVAESLARGVAFATTWVACTAGLGAALISRAGITQVRTTRAQKAMESPSWQTPTPVSGVVAARRPVATPSRGPG